MSKSDNVREFILTAGFDKRNADDGKNYGIGGAHLGFYYGNKVDGIVQFTMLTDWYPKELREEMKDQRHHLCDMFPMAADLGYHSPVPQYEGQQSMECDRLEGEICFYDGSGLNAQKVMDKLLEEGSEEAWKLIEEYWDDTFGDEESKAEVEAFEKELIHGKEEKDDESD